MAYHAKLLSEELPTKAPSEEEKKIRSVTAGPKLEEVEQPGALGLCPKARPSSTVHPGLWGPP